MTAQHSHGTSEYLEAIYELGEEGVRVVQARIAQRLGITRAAVSEQVARLTRMKLLSSDGREIRLTARGFKVAEEAVRKHRMAERFLTDVLRLPWHQAHAQAVTFQAGITPEIEERMRDLLSGPATCPHGNPIPGTGATIAKDLLPLNEFGPGAAVTLQRLTEDVELDDDAMRYFEMHGLMPGARIEILSVSPDGSMSLQVGDTVSSLGPHLTDNLWVRPVQASRRKPRATTPRPRRKSA